MNGMGKPKKPWRWAVPFSVADQKKAHLIGCETPLTTRVCNNWIVNAALARQVNPDEWDLERCGKCQRAFDEEQE